MDRMKRILMGHPRRFPLPAAGMGALLAKIRYANGRDSNSLAVGAANTLSVEQGEYGRLWFGINDDVLTVSRDRKSTPLNSNPPSISDAPSCLRAYARRLAAVTGIRQTPARKPAA